MTAPHISDADILTAARFTLTRMTGTRIAAGMTPDAAFRSALDAFLRLCAEHMRAEETAERTARRQTFLRSLRS